MLNGAGDDIFSNTCLILVIEMAPRINTQEKILDAAELLFAEHGFNSTSLRTITSKAGVNLAAVNYHFGDKKTLVRAVLDRYLEAFMPAVNEELVELNKRDKFSMQALFESLRGPLKGLDSVRPNGMSRFMLLIGRGYTDVKGHLRWFITTRYQDTLSLFTDSVMKANPKLRPEKLFWRLHFTLGACIFTMASSQALLEIAQSEYDQNTNVKSIVDELIPYLAAGVAE